MNKIYLILILIISIHLLLLSKITFFPNSELFIYPYLTNKGLVPYQDIWDRHSPGLLFSPINFDNLGMNTPIKALYWHLITIGINQVLIFILVKKLFKKDKIALLSSIIYALFQPLYEGYIQWLDVFLPIFILSSIYYYFEYLEKDKFKDLILSGFIIGAGLVFKQVLLPVAVGLELLLLIRQKLSEVVIFGFSISVPVLVMIYYLISIKALDDFWYWAVIYNLTIFADSGTKAIPSFSHFIRFVGIYGLALIYIIRNLNNKKILILGIGFVASLATVAARFDFVHLQASLPLGVILIAYGLINEKHYVVKAVTYGILLIFTLSWSILFYSKHLGQGVLYFDENIYQVANSIKQLTEDNEEIFLYGSPTHLYQMTNTIPAGRVFVFQFPWFMQVAEERVLEKLKTSSPNVVVQNRSVTMQGIKLIDYAPKLDEYISDNYKVIEKIGNDEIMIKK